MGLAILLFAIFGRFGWSIVWSEAPRRWSTLLRPRAVWVTMGEVSQKWILPKWLNDFFFLFLLCLLLKGCSFLCVFFFFFFFFSLKFYFLFDREWKHNNNNSTNNNSTTTTTIKWPPVPWPPLLCAEQVLWNLSFDFMPIAHLPTPPSSLPFLTDTTAFNGENVTYTVSFLNDECPVEELSHVASYTVTLLCLGQNLT